jgi:hypothetical protein
MEGRELTNKSGSFFYFGRDFFQQGHLLGRFG